MHFLHVLILLTCYQFLSEPIHGWKIRAEMSFFERDGRTPYNISVGLVNHLAVRLDTENRSMFHLNLHLNTRLFSKNYIEREVNESGAFVRKIDKSNLLCYYNGWVLNDNSSSVAISLCDGMSGSIMTNGSTYEIIPATDSDKWTNCYVVKSESKEEYVCGFKSDKGPKLHWSPRRKRSTLNFDRVARTVETLIVIEHSEFVNMNKDPHKATARSAELLHISSTMFHPLDIFLIVIGTEILQSTQFSYTSDPHKYLHNWKDYRVKAMKNWPPHDLAVLVVKLNFGKTIGMALENVMCKLSNNVAFVVDGYSLFTSAATLTHEIGHTFGVLHDESYYDCKCPTDGCLMAATIANTQNYSWSDCSISLLLGLYETGSDICLFNKLETLAATSSCGNGFVELGEECDCGKLPMHICSSRCCDTEKCTLKPGSKCAHGLCCDLSNCQLVRGSVPCRPGKGNCDVSESCNGVSNLCPEDKKIKNGTACSGGDFCFDGNCVSKDRACSILYGRDTKASTEYCYRMNTKGNEHYNCGFTYTKPGNFEKCAENDIYCGTLICHAPPVVAKGAFKRYKSFHVMQFGNSFCAVIIFDVYDGVPDLGYVPDGAKCGKNGMCFNKQCVDPGSKLVRIEENNVKIIKQDRSFILIVASTGIFLKIFHAA